MGFFKKVFKSLGSMLGITESPSQEKARKQAEAQAREMKNMQDQQMILNNANEMEQVATIQEGLLDDGGGGGTSLSGTRRKKQATGGATTGLGITI